MLQQVHKDKSMLGSDAHAISSSQDQWSSQHQEGDEHVHTSRMEPAAAAADLPPGRASPRQGWASMT